MTLTQLHNEIESLRVQADIDTDNSQGRDDKSYYEGKAVAFTVCLSLLSKLREGEQ